MADQRLTFHGWARERIAGLATGVQDGRAKVTTTVTLTGTAPDGAPTGTATGTVNFLLAGPADVVGPAPGAITNRYPAPGTIDHETDRCPHVEFADVTLPWRYTPAPRPAAGTGGQHPWLVLVTGRPDVELTLAAGQVTLTPGVQQKHPLGAAGGHYPWAHVQQDAEGRRIARVLSGSHPLEPGTDYVAVLVPAFDAAGQRNWNGTAPVSVQVYDWWAFRTATPPGSFEDLAALLRPGAASPETGRAPLDYPRVPEAGDLEVRGALAPLGAVDAPLPAAVFSDLDGLRTPARDDKGRPIVGLPRYGEAWRLGAPEQTVWGGTLNTDPRDRGVAGVGLELGIRLQEELSAEVSASAGALAEARQRIAQLVLGLQAAGGLWNRRMPADPLDRLWLLGPALGRVVTPSGTVADLATAADRPLPSGVFSTALRRILRTGPPRTRLTTRGRVRPRDVLIALNDCPREPGRSDDGVPLSEHGIDPADLETNRQKAVETGHVELEPLAGQAHDLAARAHPDLRELTEALARRLERSHADGSPAPWAVALASLAAAAAVRDDKDAVERLAVALRDLLERYPHPASPEDLLDLLRAFAQPPADEVPCDPVDLGAMSEQVGAAFDPTGVDGPARVRVLATVTGLDAAQPLAPPEVCVGLDRPVWSDVNDAFAEWLLPGVGALPDNSVIALETNPRFVDSLLVGLNTQLLAELRWRNIPVATGCTPLREFWNRRDTATGLPVADIRGILTWPDASELGTAPHRPAGVSQRDLVIVSRGQLFLRYPATLVYLVTAEHGGVPDFGQDPDPAAPRVFPGFQGRLGTDVTFFGFQGFDPDAVTRHWLVFEEPPAGYRFANDQSASAAPQTWAAASFARPVRVLIRGDRLDPEG
ncbi:hypothetical protein [Streptosporangium sp. KLBMP 9127]|nr:hypothetical protein [Streptosporangium sp. KLBMP 9127]